MALQVYDVWAATDVPTTSTLQVFDVWAGTSTTVPTLTGTVTVSGQPVTAVGGGGQVTMTVAVTGAYTSTTWTVQPGSPAGVQLAGTDLVKSFTAPALVDADDVVIYVTATGPGGTSAPLVLSIEILPTIGWYLNAAGVWAPGRMTVLR